MTMTDRPSDHQEMNVFHSDDAPRPRSRRLRIGAAVLGVVVLAAAAFTFALGGGSGNPAKSRQTRVTHPGPTATTSPYALNHDPPPSLAGAYSDNLKTAFLALYAYHSWIFEHPDPTQVARYAVSGSPDYKVELYNVNYLVAHNAHTPNDPRGLDGDIEFAKVSLAPKLITGADGRPTQRDGHPAFASGLITAVAHYAVDNLYDPVGHYVQPGQRAGLVAITYSLSQGADGQWRLYQAQVLNPPGGAQSVER